MKRSFLSDNECQKTPNFEGLKLQFKADQVFQRSGTSIRSRPDSELHFEVNWGISKVQQTFNFKGGLYSKSADEFLEEISKNFKGLQLLNTTGLNFEDSASKRNFEGPRLPERLMDGISEVCA
ncbi:hypothetical protein RclHR1_26320001 [Rhizophagus clarus]|uniref:Uncharacterized protein n=1 Tax=Rhizophagus clarus TaxID=94130 RepID=A0A2Z6R1Q2_9GLOM|nr:hypothetical protein RclHR1_26320001 [Rhizophagus clarus]